MKADILQKLQTLLESDDVLSARKEFRLLSSQFKSLAELERPSKDDDSSKLEETKKEDLKPESAKEQTKSTAPPVEEGPESKSESLVSEITDETKASKPEVQVAEESIERAEEIVKKSEDIEAKSSEEATKPSEEATSLESESSETSSNEVSENKDENDEISPEISPEPEVRGVDAPSVKTGDDSGNDVAPKADPDEKAEPEEDQKFKELTALFKSKVSEALKEKERIEVETVKKAEELIQELENLVKNEENIGKAFNGFNAIQEHWKALPRVSNDAYRDLNAAYNKHVEFFFYNINIYKELKDLDLKHNLEQKLRVLEDQKKLVDLNDIRLLEVEVRLNQDRWNEIGPTYKEEWDKIKDEFWTITREIYRKIQQFYNERRESYEKNLEAKKALMERLLPYADMSFDSHKKWQQKTKEVIELQKEWKLIGHVPKEHSKKLWKEFRLNCDKFFDNKRKYFDQQNEVQKGRKEAKQSIVEKAEALKTSTDWGATSKELADLHTKWKEIGPASHRDENKLWYKFRKACDQFFEARNAQRSEEEAEQKVNLEAKNELIKELEAYEPGENRNDTLKKLKELNEKWRSIGHVPFKAKNKVNKAFMNAMDAKYGALNIDKRQKEKIKFENRVQNLKSGGGSNHLLRKEEDSLRYKISKLESEVIRYETNIGFFAASKGADKFKADISKNIEKAKAEINELKERLKMLREA